jgi:hypothetical protein
MQLRSFLLTLLLVFVVFSGDSLQAQLRFTI